MRGIDFVNSLLISTLLVSMAWATPVGVKLVPTPGYPTIPLAHWLAQSDKVDDSERVYLSGFLATDADCKPTLFADPVAAMTLDMNRAVVLMPRDVEVITDAARERYVGIYHRLPQQRFQYVDVSGNVRRLGGLWTMRELESHGSWGGRWNFPDNCSPQMSARTKPVSAQEIMARSPNHCGKALTVVGIAHREGSLRVLHADVYSAASDSAAHRLIVRLNQKAAPEFAWDFDQAAKRKSLVAVSGSVSCIAESTSANPGDVPDSVVLAPVALVNLTDVSNLLVLTPGK